MPKFQCTKNLYSKKPVGAEIKACQAAANYLDIPNCSVEDIFIRITRGQAWRAGYYNLTAAKGFGKNNVIGVSNMALDFDASIYTPWEVVEYAREIGFEPNMWYYSYSQNSKAGNSFRLVWVLEDIIAVSEYENAYVILLERFAEYGPDGATKDASRLWFGTVNGGELLNETPITFSDIGWLNVVSAIEEGKEYKDIIKRKKGYVPKYKDELENANITKVPVDRAWWELLRGRCSLWDKWERGEFLEFNQRLVLWTNLKYLVRRNDRDKIIDDIWQFYNPKNYEEHPESRKTGMEYRDEVLGIFRGKLLPRPIVVDGKLKYTISDFFSRLENGYIIMNNKQLSIEELDGILERRIPEILEESGINYVRSQTASGKTELIIQWLAKQAYFDKKIIYSAPTYDVMEEFVSRLKAAMGKGRGYYPVFMIPKGHYTERELQLMKMGVRGKKSESFLQSDRMNMIQALLSDDNFGVYVVSHQLLSLLPLVQSTNMIIIDENIESAAIFTANITEEMLNDLNLGLENEEDILKVRKIITTMKAATRGDLINIKPIHHILMYKFDYNRYLDKTNKPIPNIHKLCLYNEIRVGMERGENVLRLVKKTLFIEEAIKHNIPIKFFTATPQSTRLLAYYKDIEIKYEEFPLAANKGEILQYRGKTGARGFNNEKVSEMITYIKGKIPQEVIDKAYVLSFKGSENMWMEAGFKIPKIGETYIHLANNAGLDRFKGETMIIAGKYDYDDDYYLNLYYDTFDGFAPKPIKVKTIETIGGIQQELFLWNDQTLREIQKENIQLAIEQSAGRARALREAGATVYIFSNYIIRDVDKVYE